MAQRPARPDIRIDDLKRPVGERYMVMTARIPITLADAIAGLAKRLGASKAEVTIALLNSGLDEAAKKHGGRR